MGRVPGFNPRFSKLGSRLRTTREDHSESLAEASDAVEIEVEALERIERGEQRPSEEILLLLISHFGISDDEAARLWELAGYEDSREDKAESSFDMQDQMKQVAFVLPMDIRVVYTDMVHVSVNNYGVVMNFIQNAGPGNQPLAVARVGMSREHAQSVLQVLQQTLAQSEKTNQPKTLEAPKPKTRKTDTN